MVEFAERVAEEARPLRRDRIDTLQINVGKLCNQACVHCHVDAGPRRTEIMPADVAERILDWLARSNVPTVDITGGAPELTPCFRRLVERASELGRAVIVRHNFTVQHVAGQEDLPEFFRDHRVRLIGSLPCYLEANVDRQRGKGVYAGSIAGLRRLNAVGYGRPESELTLDLVYTPLGPSLPPPQGSLRDDYAAYLSEHYGIVFNDLLTITNVPINRFRHQLQREGKLEDYYQLLEASFNPSTVGRLMCRTQLSVDWTGLVYDCDFNQMLDWHIGNGRAYRLWERPLEAWLGAIQTGRHCYACTAGCGSSCRGALA
ncbi:MAG: arsenosugar biosynthesis radical SAM protein ArsS [Armatimonadetes bacterium]|nr:arsenosugar biosynthesis radical SAM protein ArsS [Armatimonadota bacterium]